MKKTILFTAFTISFFLNIKSQGFYDINTINTIEITFQESNWDYILDQMYAAGDEDRLIGTATINGEFYDSVGVRYKGNSSYNPNQVKNPLNIKLDYVINDQTIEGYGTIKLANGFKDPSFIREVLGYEIARKYFPASLSNYSNVYINGTHLGLYTSDQSVDKFFMQSNFGSNENTRLKGEITTSGPPSGGVWEYYGQDSSDYYGYYDLKSDYGWSELINFLDTLNNNTEYVEQVLNIDRHLWFLAFSNLIVNLDGPINNPQNHYLYKDHNGLFNTIPWDLNECFGVFGSHQTLGNLNTYQLQHFSPDANISQSSFPVVSKIISNETYHKIYIAHMKTILEENFIDDQYIDRALEIQNVIDNDVMADPNKLYTYNDFLNNIYTSTGGGGWPPGQQIIGISELMEDRIDYLMSLNYFQYEEPEISNVNHFVENEIIINAEVANSINVFLGYRSNSYDQFIKTPMYDDGAHGDGTAGDGIYGIEVDANYSFLEYYIYAENSDAVSFSPARAEYEFYEINLLSDLVINEFMADNETAVADQDGEYDDWIEFYNNGSETINLNGYFLSDDFAEPDKWVFPDTVINAGEYLIVWADKDEEQTGLHADIKLSANGEMIIISNENMNVIDQVVFGPQIPDTTTGRYPNGTGSFIEMPATFASQNTTILTVSDEINSFVNCSAYPNPFSDKISLNFELNNASDISLHIMNCYGQSSIMIDNEKFTTGYHTLTFNTDEFKPGLWICNLIISGQTFPIKVIKL